MVSFFFCLRIMKKIIYFISEDWVFLNHRFDLAKKIISSGFKLSLITKVSNYKKEIEEKKINVINLKTERGSLNIRKSLKDIYKIFKIYKKLKPDIVHHFGIRQIVHGNIAARLAGIKKSYNSITGLGSVFISGNKFEATYFLKKLNKDNKRKTFSKEFSGNIDFKVKEIIINKESLFNFSGLGQIQEGKLHKLTAKANFSDNEILDISITPVSLNKKKLFIFC